MSKNLWGTNLGRVFSALFGRFSCAFHLFYPSLNTFKGLYKRHWHFESIYTHKEALSALPICLFSVSWDFLLLLQKSWLDSVKASSLRILKDFHTVFTSSKHAYIHIISFYAKILEFFDYKHSLRTYLLLQKCCLELPVRIFRTSFSFLSWSLETRIELVPKSSHDTCFGISKTNTENK